MLKDNIAGKLAEFVKNGGTVLITYISGYINENCEMKYSSNELFSISPKYAKDVRDRMAMFRASGKTRKDLRCTFVTVYGVKQNPNSDIVVDQVILDDLFT